MIMTHEPARMQCMEVWGGNRDADNSFDLAGLRLWLYSLPYEQSSGGGDVYYVSSCASGRITRMLLADVSGHGQAVSNVAAGLRDLMRRNINMIKQTRLVTAMNREFGKAIESSETPHTGGFATAIVCTFFSPTRSLQFSNAGHPTPLVYRRATSTWELLTNDDEPGKGIYDTPLGLLEQADYTHAETSLDVGDMVLCLSDAFTESCQEDGSLIGTEGIRKVVESLDPDKPQFLIAELRSRLEAMHSGNLLQDDATAMLFEADGSQPSVKDNLMAPIRYFRGARDSADE